MKELTGKWWFWLIITILIVLIGGILINAFSNDITKEYKKQAISVLNEYKSGKLTDKQASDKLKSIADKIAKEPENEDEYNSAKIFALEMKISRLSLELLNEGLSNTEVNKNIKEIKNT